MFVGHPLAESTKQYQLGDDVHKNWIIQESPANEILQASCQQTLPPTPLCEKDYI